MIRVVPFLLFTMPVHALSTQNWNLCRDYLESYWDNGKRTITSKYEDSVALYGGPENYVFRVKERGNRVRNPDLMDEYIVCSTRDGQRFELSKYPEEESEFAAP